MLRSITHTHQAHQAGQHRILLLEYYRPTYLLEVQTSKFVRFNKRVFFNIGLLIKFIIQLITSKFKRVFSSSFVF